MSMKDQIEGVIKQKQVLIDEMESMLNKAEETAAPFDEGEQKEFDALKNKINDLNARQKNLEDTEQLIATQKAKPVDVKRAPAKVEPLIEKDKTLYFARELHALYMCNNNRGDASRYAKEMLGDELLSKNLQMPAGMVSKAAVAAGDKTTDGWASQLVETKQMNEAFIDMLRPRSIVARFPGRQLQFDGAGAITIPRQTAGVTGGWVAEDGGIKVNKLTFDSISLSPNKNGVIVPMTNELLASSNPSAMAIVRDDLINGVATSIDTKFVSADAASAGVSPAGIQTFDSASAVSAGDTLDNITTDLKGMISAMNALNMPMAAPVWFIHPTRLNSLRFIRDGLGTYVFRDEIANGMLVGYPIIESTTVSTSVVMLADANQIVIATDLAPQIAISTDASIHMVDASVETDIGGGGTATPVQSMFQTDATAVRITTRLDWEARYANCVQVLTSVSW